MHLPRPALRNAFAYGFWFTFILHLLALRPAVVGQDTAVPGRQRLSSVEEMRPPVRVSRVSESKSLKVVEATVLSPILVDIPPPGIEDPRPDQQERLIHDPSEDSSESKPIPWTAPAESQQYPKVESLEPPSKNSDSSAETLLQPLRDASVMAPNPTPANSEPQIAEGIVQWHDSKPASVIAPPNQTRSYCPTLPSAAKQKDGSCLLTSYIHRAQMRWDPSFDQASHSYGSWSTIPGDFRPWWATSAAQSVLIGVNQGVPCPLSSLLHRATQCSPQIQLAATEPQIQRNRVIVESAQFDWQQFLNSEYDNINDPIGNRLTTGNNDDRFLQSNWTGSGGLRRRNRLGGQLELSQQLGYLNNNSVFLLPPNQGSSRLQINYRHPVLRGSGRFFNESLIMVAKVDYQGSVDQLVETTQTQLANVAEVYWELYRVRSEYLQKQKLIQSADTILAHLEARAGVDASPREILRTKAALESRKAEIARQAADIRNTESQLRLLVLSPELIDATNAELLPSDLPTSTLFPMELSDALSTALTNRRDISQAIRRIRSANIRAGVAKKDLLPRMDMIVGTYVAGLDGNSDVFNSFVNQFRDGRPGFNVGFEFELPRGNRAAKAQQQRRAWELNRELQQFRAVVEQAMTEVEFAVRDLSAGHAELTSRYSAMQATAEEAEYLLDRWTSLPGLNDSYLLLLEDLLEAQERLAREEAAYAAAQANYAFGFTRLHQVMGTLFQMQP